MGFRRRLDYRFAGKDTADPPAVCELKHKEPGWGNPAGEDCVPDRWRYGGTNQSVNPRTPSRIALLVSREHDVIEPSTGNSKDQGQYDHSPHCPYGEAARIMLP